MKGPFNLLLLSLIVFLDNCNGETQTEAGETTTEETTDYLKKTISHE